MFELRRDPVTGWWSAIVTDRAFEHASFTVEAAPVEGTHCRHCDEAPEGDDDDVRRVTLRADAFQIVEPGREPAAQLSMLPEVAASRGSWEIVVGPRDHHERFADAQPHLAERLMRAMRDGMLELGAVARPPDEPIYVQALQSYGRQAGSRSQHLNFELYAIPQIPHRVAEEIGGAARHMISRQTCVWCAMAAAEEENGARLVLADERFVVVAPAASRSAFELLVIPREHAADFTGLDDEAMGACRATLQRTLGALGVLGDPPYNLFLHTAPAGERLDQTFHWHWELHPRLRVIAGLERATALAVNPAAPEYAAEVLRDHLARAAR
jgi:UDPglucose--hexose-1-phosphate uridylyltransferase